MYVRMHMYTYICIDTYVYISCVYIPLYVCIDVCILRSRCMYRYVHMYVNMYACKYTTTHTCICVCIHMVNRRRGYVPPGPPRQRGRDRASGGFLNTHGLLLAFGEFPNKMRVLLWGPYIRDPSILGPYQYEVPLIFGNPQLGVNTGILATALTTKTMLCFCL